MPIPFKIQERLAGFIASSAKKGDEVPVIYRELLGPEDADLSQRLDQLHSCLFAKIQGLPHPSKIGTLTIVLKSDLSGTAYIDELDFTAKIKPNRPVSKGDTVFLNDVLDIESINPGIEISDDSAVVVVQTFLWKRSLFYDFGPLHEKAGPRDYKLEKALAQQMLLLFGLPAPQPMFGAGKTRIEAMRMAIKELEELLSSRCEIEAKYQNLIERNPWMLGASYSAVNRHIKMDDQNIPDFTALRAYDQCNDVVELKQPFLPLFRENGDLAGGFNDSWNQSERYLDFCHRQRAYLLDQKNLRFENPRCILLMGYDIKSIDMKSIRTKESMNRLISVLTYDHLLEQARHVLRLVDSASDKIAP